MFLATKHAIQHAVTFGACELKRLKNESNKNFMQSNPHLKIPVLSYFFG